MTTPVLIATNMYKSFGSVKALQNVDFHLDYGEIHALLGINGAGKSTFIKILSGIIQKDGGTLNIDGQAFHFRNPDEAIRAGIASVQQHPELVMDMTGFENIFLGRETKRGILGRIDRQDLLDRAERLLDRFSIPINLSLTIADMSAVEREIIAILQAMASDNIKILILDEPTSTLTNVEREYLFQMMKQLRSQGISIIYITHQLEEVFSIADSFSVFRGGRHVARMSVEDARNQNISLATIMLGKELDEVFPPNADKDTIGEVVLSVCNMTLNQAFNEITFDVRQGEIFGIFGLVGSGSEELSKVIFGIMQADKGTLLLDGKVINSKTPREALDAGIFLVPGDRRTEGLVLSRSFIFNLPLANLTRATERGWVLNRRKIRQDAQTLTQDVDLYPPDLNTPASGFSGGNQQKIVLARGLYSESKVYIFVEPTVGVDIGARAKIYRLIRKLSQNAAVIVVSSDCDEVHGIADRTIALHKGNMVEDSQGAFNRDALLIAGIMGGTH